jgi:hypothetical protein
MCFFGTTWLRVKSIPANNGKWFAADDKLQGNGAVIGSASDMTGEYNIGPFSGKNFNKFLFKTGDSSTWLITEKASITAASTETGPKYKTVLASSLHDFSYMAKWDFGTSGG